jgi:hypothetical protein
MNAESFWSISIGDLIALITVIIAVFALWSQIKGVNQQLFIQNYSEYTKRYQEIIIQFPEKINELEYNLAPSNLDYDKTMRAMRQYFDLCFEEYFLNKNKKLDAIIWESWKNGMLFAFSKTAFRTAWVIIEKDTQYSADFITFVKNHNSNK